MRFVYSILDLIPTVRSYLRWRFCLTLPLAYGSCLRSLHRVGFRADEINPQ